MAQRLMPVTFQVCQLEISAEPADSDKSVTRRRYLFLTVRVTVTPGLVRVRLLNLMISDSKSS